MEVLQLHGREFVKASKAARDLGYAPDYIGQLCRSGAIRAERVGRNWYVDAEEMADHKQSKQRSVAAKSRASLVKRVSLVRHVGETGIRTTRTIQPIEYAEDDAPLVPRLSKRSRSDTHAVQHEEMIGAGKETDERVSMRDEYLDVDQEDAVVSPENEEEVMLAEHVHKIEDIRPVPVRVVSTEHVPAVIKVTRPAAAVAMPAAFRSETFSVHAVPLKKAPSSRGAWLTVILYLFAIASALCAVFARFDAIVTRDGAMYTYRFDPHVPEGVLEVVFEELRQ